MSKLITKVLDMKPATHCLSDLSCGELFREAINDEICVVLPQDNMHVKDVLAGKILIYVLDDNTITQIAAGASVVKLEGALNVITEPHKK